ncbi:GNAT family N-acetyltransferase [Chryseobacterium daecheongense]|uniref:GNAT family N-acetyltransferase n=1 Tax=Chryseobacterium daecheongense TaxID=192389 RepID=UPI001FD6A217|nr:GNAT family N-acetyltransferase [Chryseobacterium daecheongense]UOU97177.1 GNAT family N-acetyltransferase [Chryseobacterium daecheongense]
MKISRLNPDDSEKLRLLEKLYVEVFEVKNSQNPGLEYFKNLLKNDNFIYLIAENEYEITGGLTAYLMPSLHGHLEVYVYDLAVKNNFQRKGIGTLLMQKIFEISKNLDAAEVFLQADNVDEHALRFYRKLKGIPEEDITNFSYKL